MLQYCGGMVVRVCDQVTTYTEYLFCVGDKWIVPTEKRHKLCHRIFTTLIPNYIIIIETRRVRPPNGGRNEANSW